MIQFLGLTFSVDPDGARATCTVVDRKALVLGEGSAPIGGISAGEGAAEVRAGEWLRAGSLALRDAYMCIPGRIRRLWGFGLAGPPGWVALDPSLDPITPIRLTPRPREDLLRWLADNPREKPHVYAVLSPKDYFRYVVSGGLAIDITQSDELGVTVPGTTRWDTGAIEALGLLPAWFPPIFESAGITGRISEEGIRRTSLPGGLWVASGAETGAGSLISAADPRSGVLFASTDGASLELRAVAEGVAGAQEPAGFETRRAPIAGHRVLRRAAALPPATEAAARGNGSAAVAAARDALESLRAGSIEGLAPPKRLVLDYRAGRAPEWAARLLAESGIPGELSPYAGAGDPGVAFLAGLAQGAYRSLDDLYRKLREAKSAARIEAAPPPGGNP